MQPADDKAVNQMASGTKVACGLDAEVVDTMGVGASEDRCAPHTVGLLPSGRPRSASSDARVRWAYSDAARAHSPLEARIGSSAEVQAARQGANLSMMPTGCSADVQASMQSVSTPILPSAADLQVAMQSMSTPVMASSIDAQVAMQSMSTPVISMESLNGTPVKANSGDAQAAMQSLNGTPVKASSPESQAGGIASSPMRGPARQPNLEVPPAVVSTMQAPGIQSMSTPMQTTRQILASPVMTSRLCAVSSPVVLQASSSIPCLVSLADLDQPPVSGSVLVSARRPTSPTLLSQCRGGSVHVGSCVELSSPSLVSRDLPQNQAAGSVRVRARVLSPTMVSRPQEGPNSMPFMAYAPVPSVAFNRSQSAERVQVAMPPKCQSPRPWRMATHQGTPGTKLGSLHATPRLASPERQGAGSRGRVKVNRAVSCIVPGPPRSRSAELTPRPLGPSGSLSLSPPRSVSPPASRDVMLIPTIVETTTSPQAEAMAIPQTVVDTVANPLVETSNIPQTMVETLSHTPPLQFQPSPVFAEQDNVILEETSSSLAARARVEILKGVAQAQFDEELDGDDLNLEAGDAASAGAADSSVQYESILIDPDASQGLSATAPEASMPISNGSTHVEPLSNEDIMNQWCAGILQEAGAAADCLHVPSENNTHQGRPGIAPAAGALHKQKKGVKGKFVHKARASENNDNRGSMDGLPCPKASGAELIQTLSMFLKENDLDLDSSLAQDSDSGSPVKPLKLKKEKKHKRSRKSPTRMSSGTSLASVPENDVSECDVDCLEPPCLDPPCSAEDLADMGRVLFTEAMSMSFAVEESRHPQRTGIGRLLLEQATPVLRTRGLAKDSDAQLVKRLFYDSMPERLVTIDSIEQVISPKHLRRFLKIVAEEPGAVEATFHGTKPDLAEKIVIEGLSTSICQTGAFGHGAYVGTHAGVAHQYADADKEGWRYMCLVLVVAGKEVVKGKQGEQPPATALDSLTNPTQYCFVDEERLLVSHLITYRAQRSARKRIGGGWHDPYQSKLSGAVRRAAQRSRKHGPR